MSNLPAFDACLVTVRILPDILCVGLLSCSVAEYEGEFVADASDGGFLRGTQWLVWNFESDATLADACQVRNETTLGSVLSDLALHNLR